MLTNQVRWFTREDMLYLLKSTKVEHLPLPVKEEDGVPMWTNKQAFSVILPDGLNMVFKASSCANCDTCKRDTCERDAYVQIIDGELKSGTIDKKAIGAFDGQIVQRVIRQYGMKRAADFIDDMTKLSIRSIMLDGFSFGIDDEDLSKTEYGQIAEVLDGAVMDVQKRIRIYEDGQLGAYAWSYTGRDP